MDIFVALWTICTLFLIFGTGICGGIVPIVLKYLKIGSVRLDVAFPYLNALSGGIFIGGGFLHLLPDSQESFEGAFDDIDYPVPTLIAVLTMGFMVTIEYMLSAHDHAHNHTHNHEPSSDDESLNPILGSPESPESPAPYDPHTIGDHLRRYAFATFLFVALTFHSFVAGLGMGVVGVEDNFVEALALLFAILSHKGFAAMALVMAFLNERVHPVAVGVLLVLFCTVTPSGMIAGIILKGLTEGVVRDAIEAVGLAMSAGTFMFVGVVELFLDNLKQHSGANVVVKAALIGLSLLGFMIMAVLALAV